MFHLFILYYGVQKLVMMSFSFLGVSLAVRVNLTHSAVDFNSHFGIGPLAISLFCLFIKVVVLLGLFEGSFR